MKKLKMFLLHCSTISDEERIAIKASLEKLMLVEPAMNICTQLAIVISKIARLEIREWPSLLPCLMEWIRSADVEKQHRYRGISMFS